jgi:hypothetical protein
MFIAALFIIAGSWKEPRCPLTEEWIQKIWYIYTTKYYSAIKNKNIMMDGTRKYHPEWGNPDPKGYAWCILIKYRIPCYTTQDPLIFLLLLVTQYSISQSSLFST